MRVLEQVARFGEFGHCHTLRCAQCHRMTKVGKQAVKLVFPMRDSTSGKPCTENEDGDILRYRKSYKKTKHGNLVLSRYLGRHPSTSEGSEPHSNHLPT